MISNQIHAIDMFCGAGGSSYGANKAGVNVIAGFDYWKPALVSYKDNFPDARVYSEDIRDISPVQIQKEIGEIDLLLASPECTNHSVAKGSARIDEQSRLTAFEVTRFASALNPRWIVVENVIQMQSWTEHPRLLDELWRLGYFVQQVKLNAKDFGVPQSRNRLYLICSKSDDVIVQVPMNMEEIPVSTILMPPGEYRESPLISPRRAKATLERAKRAISKLGSNTPFLIVYYGTDGSGGWQSLNKPLRTITTLDRFALVRPTASGHVMRMLQPEELKLAMGFDATFKIDQPVLTRRQRVKLMGNGVCPPVMEYIVRSLVTKS